MKERASLVVIAKDEVTQVKRIIDSYLKYFEELIFVVDDIKAFDGLKIVPGVRLVTYEQSKEEKKFGNIFFNRKRNFAETLVKTKYYVRIDTDDEIVNVENLETVVDKAIEKNVDVVFCYYNYSRDGFGNVHAGHNREFVIKVSDDFEWKKIIHETLVFNKDYDYRTVIDRGIKIEHVTPPEHNEKSFSRNLKYLLYEYEKDLKAGKDPDMRTIGYLAKMFYSLWGV